MTLVGDVGTPPLAPRNPLSIWQLARAVRDLDTGQELIRAAGGPVTRVQLGPRQLVPPLVAVFSPDGIRDVLGRNHAFAERCIVHEEVAHTAGDSLFVLPNAKWRPRKARVAAGVHQTERADVRRPHVQGRAERRRLLA